MIEPHAHPSLERRVELLEERVLMLAERLDRTIISVAELAERVRVTAWRS